MQHLLLEQQEKSTAKSLKNLRSNELPSSSSESSNEDATGCAWGLCQLHGLAETLDEQKPQQVT